MPAASSLGWCLQPPESEKKKSRVSNFLLFAKGEGELYENTVLENEPKFNKEELGHTHKVSLYIQYWRPIEKGLLLKFNLLYSVLREFID